MKLLNKIKNIPKIVTITTILLILFLIGLDIGYHTYTAHYEDICSKNLHLFHLAGFAIFFILGIGGIFVTNKLIRLFNRCSKQKHFYETLLNNIPIPVYFKNIEGFYKYGNKAFLNQFGDGEVLNKHTRDVYNELLDEQGIDEILSSDIRMLRTMTEEVVIRDNDLLDDKKEKYVIHKFPYKDSKNDVEGIIGVTYKFDKLNEILKPYKEDIKE